MKIRDFLDKVGVATFDEAYALFSKHKDIEIKDIVTEVDARDIFNEEELKELITLGLI